MNYKQAWTYLMQNHSWFCHSVKQYFKREKEFREKIDLIAVERWTEVAYDGFTYLQFEEFKDKVIDYYQENNGNDKTFFQAIEVISIELRKLSDTQARKKTQRLTNKLNCYPSYPYCLYCQKHFNLQFEKRKTKRFCSDKCRVYFARKKPLVDLSDSWVFNDSQDKYKTTFDYQIYRLMVSDYLENIGMQSKCYLNEKEGLIETEKLYVDELTDYYRNLAISLLGLSCMLNTPENEEIKEVIEFINKEYEQQIKNFFGIKEEPAKEAIKEFNILEHLPKPK